MNDISDERLAELIERYSGASPTDDRVLALRELQRRRAGAGEPVADDLVMLTYRLIRALEMLKPGNDLGARATEYLRRHNLQGSILRAGDAAKAGGRG